MSTAAAAARCAATAAMRCRCVRSTTAATRYCDMGCAATTGSAAATGCYSMRTAAAACSSSAARITAATGRVAAATAIASTTAVTEAMAAPAVTVAPAGPWAHAQEDPVIEVPRPVITIGRTGVRRIVVIAVLTDGLNTQIDDYLSASRWRHGQARKQCCSAE
jgi:hypothetical protein